MKIIFDSEGQKQRFFEQISMYFCPFEFDLELVTDCASIRNNKRCNECWRDCVECEVKELKDEKHI